MLFEALRVNKKLPFRDLSFENFAGIIVSPDELGLRAADMG